LREDVVAGNVELAAHCGGIFETTLNEQVLDTEVCKEELELIFRERVHVAHEVVIGVNNF